MPASPGEALLSAFTPSLMSHETLEAIFVQREPLLRRIVRDIRDSAGAPTKRHYLLVGPRGIGKTHLVSLAYHRIQADPDLHERLRIAWLREEERGVVSFLHLLRRILLRLAEEYGDDALAEKAGTLFQHPDGEREGERLLLEWLGDRTLLLIAENLDDLFRRMSEDSRRPRPTARYQGAGGGAPAHLDSVRGVYDPRHAGRAGAAVPEDAGRPDALLPGAHGRPAGPAGADRGVPGGAPPRGDGEGDRGRLRAGGEQDVGAVGGVGQEGVRAVGARGARVLL